MKANELRIGNMVYDIGGIPNAVKELVDNNKIIIESPIPLNDKWLINCLFDCEDHRMYTKTVGRKSFIIYLDADYEVELVVYQHDIGCGYNPVADQNTLEYVHQLQNLFFALTGEELEIII